MSHRRPASEKGRSRSKAGERSVYTLAFWHGMNGSRVGIRLARRRGTKSRLGPVANGSPKSSWQFVQLVGALTLLPSAAFAQPPVASADAKDDFDLYANSTTNMRLFQSAMLPGPGGVAVPTTTLAPFHQSLSVAASRLDGPLQKDGTDMQVAAWGQVYAGDPVDQQQATWDLASAFVTQRLGGASISLGRQVVTGGAARYRRMDGATVHLVGGAGISLSAYAGWTALPRWDQWYGYHDLGSRYDDWSKPGALPLVADRSQNWMGGFHLNWRADKVGTIGLSLHNQAELQSIESSNIGANFALDYFESVQLTGDAIFSLEQQRLADVRLAASWDVFREAGSSVTVLGEFLHSVPSALLSQASVFSVFAYGEITEGGGELNARLPHGFGVRGSAYIQTYNEGAAGARAQAEIRYAIDAAETLLLRAQMTRVSVEAAGYWALRVAARYSFFEHWALAGDAYRYTYDQPILGQSASTFLSTQLVYDPGTFWDARAGGTFNESPYAALDAQLLARLSVRLERREP